jgi:hypothetical protein
MSAMSWSHDVVMEDGTKYTVTIDQRDIAAWERQPFGCSFAHANDRALVGFSRFVAWSALRRQGMIDKKMGWATFDDICLEVTDVQTPKEAAEMPDPTEPASSGETSST